MKKLLLLILGILFFSACHQDAPQSFRLSSTTCLVDLNQAPKTSLRYNFHKDCGVIDLSKVDIVLWQVPYHTTVASLQKRFDTIPGCRVANASLADYFLDHPEVMPDAWRDKNLLFPGTTFLMGSRVGVGSMMFDDESLSYEFSGESSSSNSYVVLIKDSGTAIAPTRNRSMSVHFLANHPGAANPAYIIDMDLPYQRSELFSGDVAQSKIGKIALDQDPIILYSSPKLRVLDRISFAQLKVELADLQKEGYIILNANFVTYLQNNWHLVPSSWQGKYLIFPNSIEMDCPVIWDVSRDHEGLFDEGNGGWDCQSYIGRTTFVPIIKR